jgi:hypothetical protein
MEIVKLGGLALGLGIVVLFSQSCMFVFSGTREDAIRAMKKKALNICLFGHNRKRRANFANVVDIFCKVDDG